jgi:hypothetical protein
MRLNIFFVLFYMLCASSNLGAQVLDSTPVQLDTTIIQKKYIYLDSATIARNLFVKDSITHIQDSITWQFLKTPALNRPNLYIDSLLNRYIIKDSYLLTPAFGANKYVFRYGIGEIKPKPNYLILIMGIFLVIYFCVVRYFFGHQIKNLFLAFYFQKYLKKINTDRNLFLSLHFLLLFLLFCLSSAAYIYLITNKIGNIYTFKGIQLLAILSAAVLLCSILNNVLIRLIGFVFKLSTITNQYLALLYISMCNMLFFILPFILLLPLVSSNYSKIIIWFSVALLAIIYVIRFIRMLLIIVSTHTFSKTYIFLYVCAFELCPLIILIRALNIV